MDTPTIISEGLLVDTSLLAVLDAGVDAMVIIGDQGEMRWISPSTAQLLRRPLEELQGLHPLELVDPEDRGLAASELSNVYDGSSAESPPVTVRLVCGDQSTVWVELTSSDLRDDPGVAGVVLAARDVSHRFQLEAALVQSEQRFEAMVRHSSDAIALIDSDATISYVSPSIERLSGYSADELVGMDARNVVLDPARTEFAHAFERVAADPEGVAFMRLRSRTSAVVPGGPRCMSPTGSTTPSSAG